MSTRKRSFSRGSNPSSVILGSEPTFEGIEKEDDLVWEINKSINWYRNNFNHSQYRNALKQYLKRIKSDSDAASAPKKAYEWEYAGIYSHLSNKGIKLPSIIQDSLSKNILALESYAKKNEDAPTVNVQENIKNKISDMIADLEIHVDEFLMNLKSKNKNYSFDVSEWIKKNNIRSIHANRMADFFKERQDELQLALSGEDEQLKEGYSWIGKTNLRKYAEFTERIVNLLHEQSAVARSERKPRAKKKKTPEQLTSKVVYLKNFDDLKLTSVSPKEIIGAARVILYNPTKRILYYYESSEVSDGLGVKGTKIINYDIKNSSWKKIRNPNILMNGGRFIQGLRASSNAYKEITGKEHFKMNGRISDQTIIVQVLHR